MDRIFETLHSREVLCGKPVPVFMHLVDYVISVMWQSCCGQSAKSHITMTKTKGRTSHGDDTFDEAILKTF
jgi:hypothetical protein